MATTALTVASMLPAPPRPEATFTFPELQVFTRIPPKHHGVASVGGMVVVFDTHSLGREPIIEGAFYVAESQHPPAGMSWEQFLQHESARPASEPRGQLVTRRRVVRTLRCASGQDRWWLVQPSGFSDGPICGWALGHNFVGKVVGIYQPAPLQLREAN